MNDRSKPVRISYFEKRICYICPKCGKPIVYKRKYQGRSLCIQCGQRLDWSPTEKIQTETITADDASEAEEYAEKYYSACGMSENEWFNLDEFRKSLIGSHQIDLYFLFKDPKEYGRFKRSIGGIRK